MRNLLSLAIALALPMAASAGEQDCLVSFSGAQQNVCTGTSSAPALESLLSLSAVKDSTLRLVKFGGPITEEQRAAVEAAGAKIISYAPYYAYIVRMPVALDSAMIAIDGVIWSGPLMPALKVDPNIYSELQGNRIVDGLGISSLEISVDEAASGGALRSAIASIPGLTVSNTVTAGGETRILASFNRARLGAAVEELAMSPDVLAVGFRKQMRLHNSQGHWLHQSNVSTPTPSKSIWDQGLYGCGQIIGELDTGLWMDNVAFKDASQPMPISICNDGAACPGIATPNYDARKVVAYYKWSGIAGTSWGDNHGHGTHVAGSILGNNNVANPGTDCVNFTTPGGDTNLDGMAPGAKLVMQETGADLAYLNTQGGTAYHMAQIAYDNGARLHSDSWGDSCVDNSGLCISGCTQPYDAFARDADRIMQDHDNLLLVFAAGNDATTCSNGNNVGSPGNAKNVLTIGATGRGTSGNNMASFSSRGPTLDARTKPELTAQGSGIVSAGRSASGTATMSGTSMATPTAAGHAALVRDYLARGFYPSGQKNPADAITDPSAALIKAVMTVGAFKMTGTGAGANPGQAQGFGRILLKDSLYFDGSGKRLFIRDERTGLATNGVDNQSLTVAVGQPLTVLLTWTDVAASINASPATVNSLRLEVQAPNGDVWTQKLPAGYGVNNANPTQDTGTSNYDNLNTLQRITLPTPVAGTYQIRVRGINVPSGPQKYALAATGSFAVPAADRYTVGGATSGLSGTGLVLKLNGANDLPIGANGAFTFPGGLTSGSNYAVTVGTQPSGQACTLANANGSIGTANVTNVAVTCTSLTYTVGGTVGGLAGTGLTLKLNGANDLPIGANGAFTFPSGLSSGSNYAVTVGTQPSGQACTLANASGSIGTANVTNVAVTCTSLTYTVGGTVGGLAGTGLTLKLNGTNDLPIAADGAFTFPGGLSSGSNYAVTVGTQPSGQSCAVANASGSIGTANVTNVAVTCTSLTYTVGGTVGGVAGMGLTLKLNGANDLPIGANGAFTFAGGLGSGSGYAVTVGTQPSAQTCTVANGNGTIANANVTSVEVTCADSITDRVFADGFDGDGSPAPTPFSLQAF